jgi:hypothetical protein
MTVAGVPPQSPDANSGRREELAKKLERLDVNADVLNRVVLNASEDQLAVLEVLAARMKPSSAEVQPEESMPLDEYRDVLERLGDEYIGTLTGAGLSSVADVRPEQLRDGVEVLAELARMMRAIPPARRRAMWPALHGEMNSALPHYQNLKRAIIETGIAAALDAEDHVIMTELRREMVPALDLMVLRMAGETDPERALLGLIRAARSAPRTMLAAKTVAQLLEDSERQLQQALQPQSAAGTVTSGGAARAAMPAAPPPPNPKRWTGWGKLFTGMATAGANIAGGIALGVGGGPLAVGVTVGGVLASCASGIGAISEGVGALRGE